MNFVLNNYFDLLPQELIREIVYYIDDYESLIVINQLQRDKNIYDKYFWEFLFRSKLGYLSPIVPIDPSLTNSINYMASMYIRSLGSLKKTNTHIKELTKMVNDGIHILYPNMNINDYDIEKIEADDNVWKLHESGFRMYLDSPGIINMKLLSQIKTSDVNTIRDFNKFLKEHAKGVNSNIELILNFKGWSLNIDVESEVWFGVYYPSIKESDAKSLLFYAFFIAGNSDFITTQEDK